MFGPHRFSCVIRTLCLYSYRIVIVVIDQLAVNNILGFRVHDCRGPWRRNENPIAPDIKISARMRSSMKFDIVSRVLDHLIPTKWVS